MLQEGTGSSPERLGQTRLELTISSVEWWRGVAFQRGGSNSGNGVIDNRILGDASTMSDSAQGGNDVLTGGNNSGSGFLRNEMYGDARATMSGFAQGGNDILIGGNSSGSGGVSNVIRGDALTVSDFVKGGDDTLIAGTQSGGGSVLNFMWGDWQEDTSGTALTGHDTFVFNENFGNQNFVEDFRQGEDLISLGAANGLSFSNDLTIIQSGSDTLVHLTADPNDAITLVGFTGTLTQSDFVGLLA